MNQGTHVRTMAELMERMDVVMQWRREHRKQRTKEEEEQWEKELEEVRQRMIKNKTK